jgi:hypothetical protein
VDRQAVCRAAPALLALLTVAGCAETLGLDGLSYDRSEAQAASGGTTGAPAPLSEPLEAAPTLHSAFPARWGASVSIAVEPKPAPNSRFWVHDRERQVLLAHGPDAPRPLEEVPAEYDWDALLAASGDGGPRLLGYARSTGLFDFGPAPAPAESFEGVTTAGTAGLTHLVVLEADPPLLLAYESATGDVRLGPAEPGAQAPSVRLSRFAPRVRHVLSTRVEGAPAVLLLREPDAAEEGLLLELVRMRDGALEEPVVLPSLARTWEIAATFEDEEGTPCLVLYDAESGEACSGPLDAALGFASSSCAHWREGVTTIAPLRIEGEPWALVHATATGVVDLRSLTPLEQVVVR